MELKVYNHAGNATRRTVELSPEVFGIEPNDHVVWLDVRRIQANARQGTHKAKERNEVAGSTRKLYRQKGTGHARAGSAKSPIRKSGGTIFGPRPRDYGFKVNKKTQRLARRSALTYKAQAEAVRVIETISLDAPSASSLRGILAALELADRKVLVLTNGLDANVARSGQNLRKVHVRPAGEASTLDVMNADVVVVLEDAVDALHSALAPAAEQAA